MWYHPNLTMWVFAIILLLVPTSAPATAQTVSVESVEALLAAGERQQAIEQFGRLIDLGSSDRAIDLRMRVNRAADELLDNAEGLLKAGRNTEATAQLSELLTTMAGLPTASLARQRLTELCARPEVQEQLKLRETELRGQGALSEARRLRDEGREDAAYSAFKQVANDFAGTSAGRAALDAVKAHESDPAFVQRSRDRDASPKARAAMSLAENYIAAGRVDLAKKKYLEVIEQFPGSTFAQIAQQRLDAMK